MTLAPAVLAASSGPSGPSLQGRFDLKSAYRQLVIGSGGLDVAQVAVWNPKHSSKQVFSMSALPFGASASVWNFIQVSLALWHVGVQLLEVHWTNFFDDYTVITADQDVRSCPSAVFLFFQLLGWTIAKDGDKSLPFSQV